MAIAILLDVGESVRSVSLEITPGTPAENPSLPSLPSDENKTRLLMYAVRLNPGATELTERDWYDYREDKNVCGYCKCILGKCKVMELMSQMAQLVAEVQENNETIAELTNKVEQLETEVEDIGDIVSVGQCGENIFYAIYSNGKLVLKGTGAMYDYNYDDNKSPFRGNHDIVKAVITEGITTIGEDTFSRCMNLEFVTLPTTLTSIGSGAFLPGDESVGYSGKLHHLIISDNVTTIGGGAFWGAALDEITIPRNVSTVGNYAFRDCSRLGEVRYEGSVIGGFMFVGCQALTRFTMANTVTVIGEHCFNYCLNLRKIIYEGSLEQWSAITKRNNWDARMAWKPDIPDLHAFSVSTALWSGMKRIMNGRKAKNNVEISCKEPEH